MNGGSEAFIIGMANTALAGSYKGSVQVNGGNVDIQNTTFRNNLYAIVVESLEASVRVHRSRFIGNHFDVESGDSNDDFRYNWWGVPDGPVQTCHVYGGQQYCYYDKIDGNFNHSDQLSQEFFRDPVIIIPGIIGSYPVAYIYDGQPDPVWELDPIFHTYDDLYLSFIDAGYVPEQTLFKFPYDWISTDNVQNAEYLREVVQQVKAKTHWPKVDIVAHSMGGLVARQYIESDEYDNDVDQLIAIGTPHLGAPEAYLKWEGAKWLFSLQEKAMELLFSQWADHSGYADTFDYIHQKPILSVRQMLPISDYLSRWNGTRYDISSYSAKYPRNEFLETLNSEDRVQRLSKVEFTKIAGSLQDTVSTVSGFNVIDADKGKLWEHGYPNDIDSIIGSPTDRGLVMNEGDTTVPLSSAIAPSLPADYEITLISSHTSLPTDSQKEVLELLTRVRPDHEVRRNFITKLFTVIPHSPIDIQVVSPSGKKMGKNFETGEVYREIPGAFYTGYHTENEFITIPNPEDGEYRILTEGTGDGAYRIEATEISEDPDTLKGIESTVTLHGTAETGKQEEQSVTIEGDTVRNDGVDTIPPTTTASLLGTKGSNDWYTSDVSVSLTAKDNDSGSGVKETKYSLDNGAHWIVYTNPITISTEGNTTLQYSSTDMAGNIEGTKSQEVKRDTIAPEGKISFNTVTHKLDIIGMDALSENTVVQVIEQPDMTVTSPKVKKIKSWFSRWFQKNKKHLPNMLAVITDDAGHTTSIAFEKTRDRDSRLFMTVQSIAYDDAEATPINGALQYKWQLNKGKSYTLFASYVKTRETNLESHYVSKKNETWLMERSRNLADDNSDDESDRRPIRKKLTGMVVPGVLTDKGEVKIQY